MYKNIDLSLAILPIEIVIQKYYNIITIKKGESQMKGDLIMMKTKQYKTVNNYLDTLDDEQIVTVFNDKHNIHYHGKVGYAPLNCYFEFINAIENGNEIIINA